MAEELLRKYGGDRFEVESGGYEPTQVHPLVVEVMMEEGVDLSNKETKDTFELFKAERVYDYVITVCERDREDECPVFPGLMKQYNWPFPDPEGLKGTDGEKLTQLRGIKEQIKEKIMEFIETAEAPK